MSGRWFLDAAALFGASRRVLSKHIALRNHQFENYDKTSSLTRVIRSQTDRVTLTVKAAASLAERFKGPDAAYTNSAQSSSLKASIPSKKIVDDSATVLPNKEGVKQDHYYNRPKSNDTKQPVPDNTLDVRQEKGERNPLPDGTINSVGSWESQPSNEDSVSTKTRKPANLTPTVVTESESPELGEGFKLRRESNEESYPSRSDDGEPSLSSIQARELQRQSEAQIPSEAAEIPPMEPGDQISEGSAVAELGVDQEKDVYYTPPSMSNPVLSSLPRVKLPKVIEDIQESDEHVSDAGMNQDVYYKSTPAKFTSLSTTSQTDAEQDPISEEMYSEIFHSPKVARLLGGGQKRNRDSNDTKLPKSSLSPSRDLRDVQDKELKAPSSPNTSNKPVLSPPQPGVFRASKIPASEDARDSEQLAADIAEDVKTGPANNAEVTTLKYSPKHYTDD